MAFSRQPQNWEVGKRLQDRRQSVPSVADTQCEGIKTIVITITPEKAATWLRKGGKNRKVSQAHVQTLVREMLGGRWSLNGETITFSQNGELLDGQHRLHAVMQSGCTIQSLVTFGINDPRAWQTIDTNQRKRGSYQILQIMGYPSATHLSAISRRLLHWETTINKSAFTFKNEAWKRISQDAVIKYAEANNAEIMGMFNEMHHCLPVSRCKAASAFVTALIILNRVDDVATYVFGEGIKTGANLPERSSITFLRDRLIAPPVRRGMDWDLEIMALTIKAWNYFIAGKEMHVLRWRQADPAPEKFPVPRGDRKNGS